MSYDPDAILKAQMDRPDDEIDLGEMALALAARDIPEISIERFQNHLKKLAQDVALRYADLLQEGAEEDAKTKLAALKHVLSDQEGYQGDRLTYDDLQNGNLIRVIERRKGLPIALCILALAAGRAQGWNMHGLGLPGHYACRIDDGPQRLIFDPFEDFKILEAQDLRMLIKRALGPNAELSADFLEPASNKDILIRLQNNLKFRLIEAEAYSDALRVVEAMRMIDPGEYRLLLEAGVLYARVDQPVAAIRNLEIYLEKAPPTRDREEAALLLKDLKASLN